MQAFAGEHDAGIDEPLIEAPIAVSMSLLGILPASLSLFAFTATSTRIVLSSRVLLHIGR